MWFPSRLRFVVGKKSPCGPLHAAIAPPATIKVKEDGHSGAGGCKKTVGVSKH